MYATKADKPQHINLREIGTKYDAPLSREAADAQLAAYCTELFALQELLYAAGQNGLLVVLQGRDTAGKDGTLKMIAGAMNPVGTRVASFKVPTPVELAHDFLWRVHKETPGRGEVVFFNRSHYEDVLVVRVHNLAPESVWKQRYGHINDFEELLAESGIIVVKFYLHISKKEQEERLLEREQEPGKEWKLSAGDWKERQHWERYTTVYEHAIGKCAAPSAPWYIVPADQKWFRNLAVAEALVETLRPYKAVWQARLREIGDEAKAELTAFRQTTVTSSASPS
jgi:PPK2 family polyphosphate:nucleotide phosphotransferase